jgi:protein-disulfide isomerase
MSQPVPVRSRPSLKGLRFVMVLSTMLFGPGGCGADVATAPATVEDRPVARWRDGQIGLEELEDELATELREMEVRYALERFDLMQRTLEARVEQELLESERARRGMVDIGALLQAEVDARAGEPTELEIIAAYEKLVEQMPNINYLDTAPQLRQTLIEQRKQVRRAAFLEELRVGASLSLALPYPAIPRVSVNIRDHDATLGPRSAPVTLVEFTEYPCPYCRRIAPLLERLQKEHADNLRLVIKDFPVSGRQFARQGAVASQCAGEQGRYWELHRHLMEHPEVEEAEQLTNLASALGLDMNAWHTCIHDEVWQIRLDQDQEDGRRAGVFATPTLFINGLQVTGAVSYALLDALVDQELERVGRQAVH